RVALVDVDAVGAVAAELHRRGPPCPSPLGTAAFGPSEGRRVCPFPSVSTWTGHFMYVSIHRLAKLRQEDLRSRFLCVTSTHCGPYGASTRRSSGTRKQRSAMRP